MPLLGLRFLVRGYRGFGSQLLQVLSVETGQQFAAYSLV